MASPNSDLASKVAFGPVFDDRPCLGEGLAVSGHEVHVSWLGGFRNSVWIDRFGGIASASCAIHCLMVGLLPALLPAMGLGFVGGAAFEWGMISAAVLFAVLAAILGARVHRSPAIGVGFFVGIGLLFLGRFAEELGADSIGLITTILGGITLISTHLINVRKCRSCKAETCATDCTAQG